MSNCNCNITEGELDDLLLILYNRYKENIITELPDDVEQFLTELITNLKKICPSLDEEKFRELIKRTYRLDMANEQFGGEDDNEIIEVPREPKKSKKFFVACSIIMLFSCIIVLYVGYIRLENFGKDIGLDGISEESKAEFKNAYGSVNREDLTAINYVWKLISTFGCNLANKQRDKIITFIQDKLIVDVAGFAQIAQKTCIGEAEYVGSLKLLGVDVGSIVDTAINYVSAQMTSDATSECITRTSQTLLEQAMKNLQTEIALLTNRVNSEAAQIGFLMKLGARGFISSVCYLIYVGIQELRNRRINITLPAPRPALQIGGPDYEVGLEQRGGKLNRMRNKKTKRHNKYKNHDRKRKITKKHHKKNKTKTMRHKNKASKRKASKH